MITSREVLIERIGAAFDSCSSRWSQPGEIHLYEAKRGHLYFCPKDESFTVFPAKPRNWDESWPKPDKSWIRLVSVDQSEIRSGLSASRWHKLVSKVNALLCGKYTQLPGAVYDAKKQLMLEVG